MKLYYIWDAYCGWCYGFKTILKPFIDNHKDIDIEVLSGGLFNQNKLISNYTHIKNANEQISNYYGVTFGKAYQDILDKGELILNSYHVASGFSVLCSYLDKDKWIDLASNIQEKFYLDGYSLSDINVYKDLAIQFQLDSDKVVEQIKSLYAKEPYHEDYSKVQSLGITSFPALLLEKNGKCVNFRGNAMTLEELESNFEYALNYLETM